MTTREGEAGPADQPDAKAETAPGSELASRAAAGGDGTEPAPLSGSVAAPPDDARQLKQEIERTRQQLGDTVQELVARVDVKSRALAKASEVSGKYKSTVTKGVSSARQHWMPLSIAAGAVIIGCLAIWRWQARASNATP